MTDFFTVRESARRARILPTRETVIFGYNGMAPGPTIKVHRGRPAILRVINELPSVHPSLGNTTTTSAGGNTTTTAPGTTTSTTATGGTTPTTSASGTTPSPTGTVSDQRKQ